MEISNTFAMEPPSILVPKITKFKVPILHPYLPLSFASPFQVQHMGQRYTQSYELIRGSENKHAAELAGLPLECMSKQGRIPILNQPRGRRRLV